MRYSDVPRVRDGALRFTTNAADEQAPVVVGSVEWYHLLEEIVSFGFEDQMGGSFMARRERRKQAWYWYAYRKRGKKLRVAYDASGHAYYATLGFRFVGPTTVYAAMQACGVVNDHLVFCHVREEVQKEIDAVAG